MIDCVTTKAKHTNSTVFAADESIKFHSFKKQTVHLAKYIRDIILFFLKNTRWGQI